MMIDDRPVCQRCGHRETSTNHVNFVGYSTYGEPVILCQVCEGQTLLPL